MKWVRVTSPINLKRERSILYLVQISVMPFPDKMWSFKSYGFLNSTTDICSPFSLNTCNIARAQAIFKYCLSHEKIIGGNIVSV